MAPSTADSAAVAVAAAPATTDAAGATAAPTPVSAQAAPVVKPPRRTLTIDPSLARTLALIGIGLAGFGQLYLLLGDPTNRTKVIGLLMLLAGAVLFGLGTATGLLPAALRRIRLPMTSPVQVFQPGPPAIAGGVGALAFLTLIVRLYIGSTVASDLLLWVVSIAAIAIPILGTVSIRRPSRGQWIEVGGVLLVMLTFIVLCSQDIDHWYYSAIGDEYAFYSAALAVLQEGIRRPFAQDGVYGAHPIIGTMFQSMVMAVFGRDHFGWVFSSVVSAALAIPAVYLFSRALAGRGVAFIAASFLAASHYIFAFSHIGYDNILAATPVAWSLAGFAVYLRRPRLWLLYATGVVAGLGFYTYYTARFTMPILALFILVQYGWRACLTPRGLRDRLLELWPLLVGFVLAAAPIFAANGLDVITRMFGFVPGGGYSTAITGPPGQKYLANFWLNVPAFFYNPHGAHFTYGSLLDPVTAALAALGIGLAIRWWARPLCKLALVWTGVAVAVSAILPPHPTTAVTWLLFSIPPLTVLAALAVSQIGRLVRWPAADTTRRWSRVGATAALLAVVLGLNLYRFWVTTPTMMHLTPEAVILGALRSGMCGPDTNRAIVAMRGEGLMRAVLLSYRPERDLPKFVPRADLKPGEPIPLDQYRCVIFGDPNDDPAKRALDDLTRMHPGGVVTRFTDYANIQFVQVFRPAATAR